MPAPLDVVQVTTTITHEQKVRILKKAEDEVPPMTNMSAIFRRLAQAYADDTIPLITTLMVEEEEEDDTRKKEPEREPERVPVHVQEEPTTQPHVQQTKEITLSSFMPVMTELLPVINQASEIYKRLEPMENTLLHMVFFEVYCYAKTK